MKKPKQRPTIEELKESFEKLGLQPPTKEEFDKNLSKVVKQPKDPKDSEK